MPVADWRTFPRRSRRSKSSNATREISLFHSLGRAAGRRDPRARRGERNAGRTGDVLFKIADHRLVWVLIDVAERDLSQVKIGTNVIVRPVRYRPDLRRRGVADLSAPRRPNSHRPPPHRSANPDEALRPAMYVDAEIETGTPGNVLRCLKDAVLDNSNRQLVLIDKGEGSLRAARCQAGRRGGGFAEVVDGLRTARPCVTSATS